MKYILMIMTLSLNSYAQFKFNYNDKVKVHSSAWNKPCYPEDDFYNVCGMVGKVISYGKNISEERVYTVRFTYPDGYVVEKVYNPVHLKKIK